MEVAVYRRKRIHDHICTKEQLRERLKFALTYAFRSNRSRRTVSQSVPSFARDGVRSQTITRSHNDNEDDSSNRPGLSGSPAHGQQEQHGRSSRLEYADPNLPRQGHAGRDSDLAGRVLFVHGRLGTLSIDPC